MFVKTGGGLTICSIKAKTNTALCARRIRWGSSLLLLSEYSLPSYCPCILMCDIRQTPAMVVRYPATITLNRMGWMRVRYLNPVHHVNQL